MSLSKSLLSTSAFAALLIGSSAPSFADEVTAPEVVFSATELPTPADQIASSVTVITAEDIERRQVRTIPDLLQTVPGLNVVQTGGPGGQTSVFIRGTNSNETKVLIDGIDVSDPSSPSGAFDFGPLTTYDIQQVEILRGPQSGLYGSDAIGGVISITTKAGKGPPKVTAMIEGGSFGTFNQAASVSGSTDTTSYAFNASHMSVAQVPSPTPIRYLLPGEQTNNDSYDNKTFSGKVDHQFSDMFSVKTVARYTQAQLGLTQDDENLGPPSFTSAPDYNLTHSTSNQFDGLTEGTLKLFDGRFNNHLGFTYTDVARHAFDPEAEVAFSPPNSDFHGQRVKEYWNADFAITKDQKLLAGVEREDARGVSNEFGSSAQGTTGNLGTFAELQSSFFDRFYITSNVRHDENDQFGDHNTFRVAPALLFPETNTKLKGSYGTGFHAPSIDQLYGPFGANLNLQPEESKGYDYGFEQAVWNKRVQFGVTWYRNDIRNLIVETPPNFINVNVAQAATHGIEAFASFDVTDRFSVRGDYTETKAIDAIADVELTRRPVNKWSAQANWRPIDALTLSATALWVSSWRDLDRESGASVMAAGYQLVNVAANYAIDKNLSVFARVDNVFNKHYENPYGWEKTGIGAFAGVRVTTD